MLTAKKNETTTFNDGLIIPLKVKDRRIVGNRTCPIAFGDRTVGYGRFWTANQSGVILSRVIVIPLDLGLMMGKFDPSWLWNPLDLTSDEPIEDVDLGAGDLIELRSAHPDHTTIYKIRQAQIIKDSAPSCMQLSLEEVKTLYDDKRQDSNRLASL